MPTNPVNGALPRLTKYVQEHQMALLRILDFWGKANPNAQAGARFHSIAYHSLDVAAVGAELIARDRERLQRISSVAGVEVDVLRSVLPFLLALHDIGKYARVFQMKSPDHWPVNALGPYRVIPPGNDHVVTGFQMLNAFSERGLSRGVFEMVLPGWRASDRKILFRALAGHHGRPPNEGERSSLCPQDVCATCTEAAEAHIKLVYGLLRPSTLPRRSASQLTLLAVGLAGLFVLADWIGSAEAWFPYTEPIEGDANFKCYWRRAQKAAKEAVDGAQITPAEVAPFAGLSQLFPDIRRPSPVQTLAETAPLPEGPCLVIIEDVTGSGKTEAALTLAHRFMAAGRATGFYIALPTEATANAMYVRLGYCFRQLFAADATPSLVLAHGRRALHSGFQDSIVSAAARAGARNGTVADSGEERPSSAECADWIADDRRKAFLADVGAGTIDQALLGILPVKHQSLRLWGLADRVLIIDEAHAYDAYMTRELEALLEFHAALGGSAIILSATLPKDTRHRLGDSFRRGVTLGNSDAVDLQSTDYPLVTILGLHSAIEVPEPIRDGLARFVTATRVDDLDGALARVIAAAEAGACVAFVRNSVDEAITAYERLRSAGLNSLLFHARFAMSDRQQIEETVMCRFGRRADERMRQGAILVATQVIEQSLDLDFDLMVTDLAPIDLMIQRAGRLWRHARGMRRIGGPELVVLSGQPLGEPDKDWANRVLGRGARVYPDHALLWRSARALFGAGGIATPDGMRALVEAVYDEASRENAPRALLQSEIRAQGESSAASSVAHTNVLLLRPQGGRAQSGYRADAGLWDSDVRTPTRLSDDSMRIRLGRFIDGVVRPWAEADPAWRAWILSEVSIRKGRIAGEDESKSLAADAIAAAKTTWPEGERVIPLIALRENAGTWRGLACNSKQALVGVVYSPIVGLSFEIE
jgi:CRISPR-associated endonuclease/helicase Cas3